ncbi:hypothetical protein GUJ93_ZPchr0006g44066 [Zizania palustris]|uniref:Uncharacterized protein n=1 Tax=Zizania palustris TaxID=103762 RepID=A0A8J5T0E6_ZIZPA|nr:hypothetical protein GUJ93_ZPchr0006g44066 [Zizania palustris]
MASSSSSAPPTSTTSTPSSSLSCIRLNECSLRKELGDVMAPAVACVLEHQAAEGAAEAQRGHGSYSSARFREGE